jgi:hypothetical protein
LFLSLAPATLASDMSLKPRHHILQNKKIFGRKLQDDSCTFEAVIAFKCTLGDYCTGLQDEFVTGGSVSCFGNVNTGWYVNWTYPETCRLNDPKDDTETVPVPYNEADFDPTTGYCSRGTYFEHFAANGVYTHDELIATFTQPVQKQGTLRQVNNYYPCDESQYELVSDDREFGGIYYCQVPCPELLEIAGMACESECGECPAEFGGSVTFNCMAVDPTIVEECGDEDLLQKIVAYFESTTDAPAPNPLVPEGESPTSAPVAKDSPTLSPREAPTLSPMAREAPTSSPAAKNSPTSSPAAKEAPTALPATRVPTPVPPPSAVAPKNQAMTFAFVMIVVAMLL